MKSESEIQQLIQLEAPKLGVTLLRNNSGSFLDKSNRLVRYGLGFTSPNQPFKSSDLIGWTEVLITSEMIGQRLAVFTAIEVKRQSWKPTKDEREAKQNNFIQWVRSRGGYAAMVNSVDEFKKIFLK
jgi:hypothetical protein